MRYDTNFVEARRAALRSTSGESLAILEFFPDLVAIDPPNGYIGEYCFRDKDIIGPISCSAREAQALGLLAKFVDGQVLEIGSGPGWSTAHIAQSAPVVALDSFGTDLLARFVENMQRTGHSFERLHISDGESPSFPVARIQLIVDASPTAFAFWPQLHGPFSMVFVDGYHHDGQPTLDVQAAIPYVTEDGIIVLHDMWLPDVKAAGCWLESEGWTQHALNTPCYMSIFSKREKPAWWSAFHRAFRRLI